MQITRPQEHPGEPSGRLPGPRQQGEAEGRKASHALPVVLSLAVVLVVVVCWADLRTRLGSIEAEVNRVGLTLEEQPRIVADAGGGQPDVFVTPESSPFELPPPEENQARIEIVEALRAVFDPSLDTEGRAAVLGGDTDTAQRLEDLRASLPCVVGVSPVVTELHFYEPDTAFVDFEVTGEWLNGLGIDRFAEFQTISHLDESGRWVIDAAVVDNLIQAADELPPGSCPQ